jgi:hypothetical protein
MRNLRWFEQDKDLPTLSIVYMGVDELWRKPLEAEGVARQFGTGVPTVDYALGELVYYRMLDGFYNSERADIEVRMAFIKQFAKMKGWEQTKLDNEVAIPHDGALISRIIDRTALLYAYGVSRAIVEETEGDTEGIVQSDEQTEDFNSYIDDAHIQAVGDEYFKQADYEGIMAVRPAWDEVKERLRYALRSPAEFWTIRDGNDNVEKYMEAGSIEYNGVERDCIYIWTDTKFYARLGDGTKIDDVNETGGANAYGVIPVSFMNTDVTKFYTGGNADLTEAQIRFNYYELLQDDDSTWSAMSTWVAINLGLGQKRNENQLQRTTAQKVSLSPGGVYATEGIQEEDVEPQLVNVSGTPHLAELSDKQTALVDKVINDNNIPPILYRETGNIPSGRALKALMKPLLDKREKDAIVWESQEKELCAITSVVLNFHAKTDFPEEPSSYVIDYLEPTFAEEDPIKEEEYYDKLWAEGKITPIEYVKRYNKDISSNDEAIEWLKENKAISDQLAIAPRLVEQEGNPNEPELDRLTAAGTQT